MQQSELGFVEYAEQRRGAMHCANDGRPAVGRTVLTTEVWPRWSPKPLMRRFEIPVCARCQHPN
jgi:hypothetical protein